jgi:hypothetical protein
MVAMAKSKDKQSAKPESQKKSENSFIKIDKKAFDPTLASLFASSVCPFAAKSQSSTNMLTTHIGRPSASPPEVTLPGSRTKGGKR